MNAAALARARALDERYMPDTCSILHDGPGAVNPDNSTEVVTTQTDNIPCRVAGSEAAAELLVEMRLTDVADRILSVPVGTAAVPTDRVLHNGLTYNVVGTDADVSYRTALHLALKLAT